MTNSDLQTKLVRARQNADRRLDEAETRLKKKERQASLAASVGSAERAVEYLDQALEAQAEAASHRAVVAMLDDLLDDDD